MTRLVATILSPLAALTLAACASVDPKPAFVDVDARISERTGYTVTWARTRAEGEESERVIRALLEKDMTADTAVRVALLGNRSLQALFEEIGISQADLAQSASLSNPSFEGFLRFPNGEPSGTNVELGVVQNLLDLVLQPLRRKIGAAQLEATKLRVGSEVLGLIADVRIAYFRLQARQQLADRLQQIVEIDRAAAEFAEQQNAAGNLSALDLAHHRAGYNQSRVDLAVEHMQARADRERLNRLLGLWGANTAWRVESRLPEIPDGEVPVEGLERLAMTQRLDVTAARWAVDVVGRALALKRGTRYFPVGIDVGVQGERETDGQRVVGPSLALELPVFDTGKASVARLEAQHRQAQRQLEALAIDARSEVREARDGMLAARDLALYYRSVLLPERTQILDQTLRQHNAMLKGAYDLLLAKQAEVSTEKAYLEAWRDYWIARVQLERSVGGRLPLGEKRAASAAGPSIDGNAHSDSQEGAQP